VVSSCKITDIVCVEIDKTILIDACWLTNGANSSHVIGQGYRLFESTVDYFLNNKQQTIGTVPYLQPGPHTKLIHHQTSEGVIYKSILQGEKQRLVIQTPQHPRSTTHSDPSTLLQMPQVEALQSLTDHFQATAKE
jgi:hypothetical protein